MQFLNVLGDWVYHLFHIVLIALPIFIVLGMVWYFVKHIWPFEDDSTLSKIVKATVCVVAIVTILILLDQKIFDEPLTTHEQLYEISEEIGIDGIQDYVLQYWDAWDVIEYVLPDQ